LFKGFEKHLAEALLSINHFPFHPGTFRLLKRPSQIEEISHGTNSSSILWWSKLYRRDELELEQLISLDGRHHFDWLKSHLKNVRMSLWLVISSLTIYQVFRMKDSFCRHDAELEICLCLEVAGR